MCAARGEGLTECPPRRVQAGVRAFGEVARELLEPSTPSALDGQPGPAERARETLLQLKAALLRAALNANVLRERATRPAAAAAVVELRRIECPACRVMLDVQVSPDATHFRCCMCQSVRRLPVQTR